MATTGPTERVSVYLSDDDFAKVKASYLADWMDGGALDTFKDWIAAAIDRHARRSATQRAKLRPGAGRARSDSRIGSNRSFPIPDAIQIRMRKALVEDQVKDRWHSTSSWIAEALDIAVDETLQRTGGQLPKPPDRLPKRLYR